jgi:CobQ-like glutamine amidotransferase family enzyme
MKLEILFPELCSLFGDPMNAEYLLRALPDAEAVKTRVKARPAFADEDVALLYLGSMTESAQSLAFAALAPHRARLLELIDGGAVVLATGNALELFGEYIEDEDGTRHEALGIFPTHAKRKMMARYNSLYLGKLGEIDVVGFKSQFSHSYGENGAGLFATARGAGLNPETPAEGLRRNNFMATYVLGPLLILNPPFLRYILGLLGAPDAPVPFEAAAMDAYALRLKEFSDPKRGFAY